MAIAALLALALGTATAVLVHSRAALASARLAAYTDPATTMLNRNGLMQALSGPITGATVAIVSLPGLAQVRAAHGHRTAEAILLRLGLRLREATPGRGVLGFRLSTDELAVLWPDAVPIDDVVALLRQLNNPITIDVDGRAAEISVQACAGLCVIEPGLAPGPLLLRANAALQIALTRGGAAATAWYDGLPLLARSRGPKTVFAVIEYANRHPHVVYGATGDLVQRQVVRVLADYAAGAGGRVADDDAAFHQRHPIPDPDGPCSDIADWLHQLRKATTAPMVTIVADDDSHPAPADPRPATVHTCLPA